MSKRPRVSRLALSLAREWKAGRSFLALAREYGLTVRQVEAAVRDVLRDIRARKISRLYGERRAAEQARKTLRRRQ